MGSHERTREGATNDWLTPDYIIDALGPFDLDPCANARHPTRCARHGWTERGLDRPWKGRVWLNPPYGPHAGKWLERLADHGDGIALIFARTETAAFFDNVWARADGLLFLRGRLQFLRPDLTVGRAADGSSTNAGAPSVLVAYGVRNVERLKASGLDGHLVVLDAR